MPRFSYEENDDNSRKYNLEMELLAIKPIKIT